MKKLIEIKNTKLKEYKGYKINEDIYVPTSLYLSHGRDDFVGGLCQIYKIWKETLKSGKEIIWCEVVERQGWHYNMDGLIEEQEKHEVEYGERRGHPQPDLHPSCKR